MSTPPPPNQPPSGGFGAPQDPPPGGFAPPPAAPPVPPAPPQQPPHQPGAAYGYPQQQPAYGYPQAPQPPQTVPAPAYVPPASGGGSGTGGTGGGSNDLRNQILIVVAAIVAIALIVGGGFWYVGDDGGKQDVSKSPTDGKSPGATGDGDKPGGGPATEKAPANTKAKTLVNLDQPKVADITHVEGSWVTDTVYVKSDVAKIVGYDLNTGAQKWSIPLPAEICGASRHASGGKTAVLFQEALASDANKYPRCNQVGAIDLNTGKLLWSTSIKAATSGDKPVEFKEVTVSGTTVAAGGLQGGAGWNIADGKNLWPAKVDGEGCYDVGYGGGEALAVIRKCGPYGSQYLIAQSLDPATGAPKSSYKMSQGIEYAHIVSTKPLVVGADIGDVAKGGSSVSDLFVLDDAGALKSRIPVSSGNYDVDCGATEVETCKKMVVGNGKVYVPAAQHQGKDTYGKTNELLSFDLSTGKQTTDRADAGEQYTIMPLRMDGPNVIAYKLPPYNKGGQIVSIDGTTMKETLLMEMPEDKNIRRPETSFSSLGAEYCYHNGRFFISQTLISKPYSDTAEKSYLFVSFTTG
ncbi:PQQ-like beta-propeller repeat protein [Streptomyces sp. NBC_00536]|uniref:outer membrane protein assembly factor BamB family protein n=1 Tax=Streptomyces sp. NBC_00536 TaxID=2975769 RepID=UPI002E808B53|nr:PQQ-binding-like beta-propeller repeat protein [Streptomyces sp. NBC_00536]WUC79481.1 PQQ-like beta-propeller repeat protein [Streptomyces sp. NBC_00536]